MNYWYSSRPNEIFLDLDSNRAVARALSVLRLAIRKKSLPVDQVWLYRSGTNGHAHMIIVLGQDKELASRLAWSLWMGNDRLRVAYILQRSIVMTHDVSSCEVPDCAFCREYVPALPDVDLLVGATSYYRQADAFCECKGKHKDAKVTKACPAMKHLLGDERSADYFNRTGGPPTKRKIRVPWGKVSLTQIRQWREVYE